MTRLRYLSAAALAVAALAAPACASPGLYRYPGTARVDSRAYDRGIAEGRREGENDARSNRRFDYERHNQYRDADVGFGGGDRGEYRRLFRQGFVAGYDEAYRRYARNGNGYPQNGPYRYPESSPWPNQRPDAVYRGGYSTQAASIGYRDGYDQGVDDARHRRRADPIAAKRYRSADHDYDRRYGSLDDYKRDYRAAFQQGYDQGYRGGY